MRLPRTKSALFKLTSNKVQESHLFSEMGLLEADLTSTRKDLYAANVRTKSLSSVLKDKSGRVQMLEEQLASHDDLLKVSTRLCTHVKSRNAEYVLWWILMLASHDSV